jgi:hypothetical protein
MHPIRLAPVYGMASDDGRRCALRQVKLSLSLLAVTVAGIVMAGAGLLSRPSAPSRPEPRLEIAIEPPVAGSLRSGYPDMETTVLSSLR